MKRNELHEPAQNQKKTKDLFVLDRFWEDHISLYMIYNHNIFHDSQLQA